MIAPASFQTHSFTESKYGGQICRILDAALKAVDPNNAVRSALHRTGDLLSIEGVEIDMRKFERVYAVGIGKGCTPMMRAILDVFGERLNAGIGIVKEGYIITEEVAGFNRHGIKMVEAGHPLPDERSIRATQNVVDLLKGCHKNDLVIFALSGGGSALSTAPVSPISLLDLQELNASLIKSGASIQEINTVRKHIDGVKGGGLARIAYPARIITFILSDVVGDPLDVIASGPTVADPSTYRDALIILKRVNSEYPIPDSILRLIQAGVDGKIPENPTSGAEIFKKVQNVLIGSNLSAAQAAIAQAKREGYHTMLLTTFLQGEARHTGQCMAAIAQEITRSGQPLGRPACVVAGGETTVTVRGNGMGGRNQEMALAAVDKLDGLANVFMVTLATDGGDGNSDAAGAVVTGETYARAKSLGMNTADYLQRNDSYHYFQALGDLLQPGPTLTNVNDLCFIIAGV
jgi:glycerate 2-kinase